MILIWIAVVILSLFVLVIAGFLFGLGFWAGQIYVYNSAEVGQENEA